MFITYKIICDITGEFYFDSHKINDIMEAIEDGYMGSGKYIRKSIETYGVENHKKEILGVFDSREESLELEHFLIKKEKQNPLCLNRGSGGSSFDYINKHGLNVYERTPETLKLQTETLKKARKIFEQKKESIPGYKEELSKKSSERCKEYFKTHKGTFSGRKQSEKTKEKIRKAVMGKHVGSKNVNYGTFWITNGYKSIRWRESYGAIPEGFRKGRIIFFKNQRGNKMTIKQVFEQCDKEKVSQEILKKYFNDTSKTDEEAIAYINSIIDEIIALEYNPHPEVKCCIKEIKENEEVNYSDVFCREEDGEMYDFICEDRKDVLGYAIDEEALNRYTIDEMAVILFWEITFFGFEYEAQNQRRLEFTQELIEALKEVDGGKTVSFDELKEEFKSLLNDEE